MHFIRRCQLKEPANMTSCCAVETESDRQTEVLGKAFQAVTTDLTLP